MKECSALENVELSDSDIQIAIKVGKIMSQIPNLYSSKKNETST